MIHDIINKEDLISIKQFISNQINSIISKKNPDKQDIKKMESLLNYICKLLVMHEKFLKNNPVNEQFSKQDDRIIDNYIKFLSEKIK